VIIEFLVSEGDSLKAEGFADGGKSHPQAELEAATRLQ